MAYTLLQDVIVPSVILNYTAENSTERSALINSGIAGPVADLSIPDKGDTVVVPMFTDLDGDPQMVQSDMEITVNKLSTKKDVARIFTAAKAWGAEDLSAELSGADPMQHIGDRLMSYWDRAFQTILIKQLQGVFADNLSNDDGDLVLDISVDDFVGASDQASHLLSADTVIDGAQLLGDAQNLFTGMAVHSKVYSNMKKQNLIEFIPEAQNDVGFGTYLGKYSVIMDDGLPKEVIDDGGDPAVVTGTKYVTYLFGQNAVAFDEGTPEVPLEVAREAAKSRTALFSRKRFIMHPRGIKWVEDTVANQTPELSEMALGVNHDRVYDKKNIRLAMIISNG